eukprot:scaffold562368_cov34-Prasinocladus_malaysianus.AAC.1
MKALWACRPALSDLCTVSWLPAPEKVGSRGISGPRLFSWLSCTIASAAAALSDSLGRLVQSIASNSASSSL